MDGVIRILSPVVYIGLRQILDQITANCCCRSRDSPLSLGLD